MTRTIGIPLGRLPRCSLTAIGVYPVTIIATHRLGDERDDDRKNQEGATTTPDGRQ